MKKRLEIIKKLRKITKISILKCKQILEKNNFNIYQSLKYFKKKKIKKKNKSFYEFIVTKTKKNISLIIKLESETDFIIKNLEFKKFKDKIIKNIIKNNNLIKNINSKNINKIFIKDINIITNKLNENIKIKKFRYLKSNKKQYIYDYNHNNKIGAIILVKKINKNNKIKTNKIKKITLHIVAMQPKYLNIKSIPHKYIKKIKNKINIKYKNNKNKNDLNKIINKKIKQICLKEQIFLFNKNIKTKKYLKKNNIKIIKYYIIKSKNTINI